jgi:type VI secretion system protein ImpK
MTPEMASVVDPIILGGLDLLERIERNKYDAIANEQERIRKLIDQGEQRFGPSSQEWQLAKYALVAWLDEQLINFPWDGREWWTNNILERSYFYGRREAFEDFFGEANRAAALPNKDALEVFHTVVLLGYRGIYSRPIDPEKAREHHLPKRLEQWAQNMAGLLDHPAPLRFESEPVLGDGGRPLEGRSQLVSMSVMALIAVVAAVSYWFLLYDRGLFG